MIRSGCARRIRAAGLIGSCTGLARTSGCGAARAVTGYSFPGVSLSAALSECSVRRHMSRERRPQRVTRRPSPSRCSSQSPRRKADDCEDDETDQCDDPVFEGHALRQPCVQCVGQDAGGEVVDGEQEGATLQAI